MTDSAIFWSVVTSLVAAELYRMSGWIAKAVARLSASFISPPEAAERFKEEWSAEVEHMPSNALALLYALGLPIAARRLQRKFVSDGEILALSQVLYQLLVGADRIATTGRVLVGKLHLLVQECGISRELLARALGVSVNHMEMTGSATLSRFIHAWTWGRAELPPPFKEEAVEKRLDKFVSDARLLLGERAYSLHWIEPPSVIQQRQSVGRIACVFLAHAWEREYLHARGLRAHWRFRRCLRCGLLSLMVIDPCWARECILAESPVAALGQHTEESDHHASLPSEII